MERPYRTPGGIFTSGVALVLAPRVAVVAGFLVDPRVVIGAAIIYGVLIAYFAFYSRHHLAAGTPNSAAIQAAEAALHQSAETRRRLAQQARVIKETLYGSFSHAVGAQTYRLTASRT